MKDSKKAQEIAEKRMQLILPLANEELDPAKARLLRQQACAETGLSERTIRRYLAAYKAGDYQGLLPKGRKRQRQKDDPIPPEIVDQAILLRREIPKRSVSQIIHILELEGLIKPNQVKRSTLQARLSERGYSSRQMKIYSSSGVAARRYQKKHRNKLWHSDIKYGPFLPIGKDGEKKQAYLVTFIDDATRFVLNAQFYDSLEKSIVEDCFRQAVLKYGVPQSVYFDNGSQYRTSWMTRACSKMGIKLLYARPYSPEGKGKIEKFNQLINSFIREVNLEKPQTLTKLNELFQVWLAECYQNRPHASLSHNGGSATPELMFNLDDKALRFLSAELIADAFLHCEQRRVDKSGCISFVGKAYEVGLDLIGKSVDVIYDPADITEITVEHDGYQPRRVRQRVIGEKTGSKPQMPTYLLEEQPTSSRLLTAAERKNKQRNDSRATAVAYRSMVQAGEADV